MNTWIEIVYTTTNRETFTNVTEVDIGDNFLTFKTNDKVTIIINLEYIIKIGHKGI